MALSAAHFSQNGLIAKLVLSVGHAPHFAVKSTLKDCAVNIGALARRVVKRQHVDHRLREELGDVSENARRRLRQGEEFLLELDSEFDCELNPLDNMAYNTIDIDKVVNSRLCLNSCPSYFYRETGREARTKSGQPMRLDDLLHGLANHLVGNLRRSDSRKSSACCKSALTEGFHQ